MILLMMKNKKLFKQKKTDTLSEKDFNDFLSSLDKAIKSQVETFDKKIEIYKNIIKKLRL